MAIKISGTTVIDDSRNLTNINSLAEATWEAGTSTTETVVSPAKVKAAIEALGATATEVSEVATTSGTAVNIITGIPSGVNKIELYIRSITLGVADYIVIQLGTSGGFVTTGYAGGITQGGAGLSISTGLGLVYSTSTTLATINSGTMNIHRVPGTNRWVAGSQVYLSSAGSSILLGSDLTQLRVTTDAGTATFSSGAISARYYT